MRRTWLIIGIVVFIAFPVGILLYANAGAIGSRLTALRYSFTTSKSPQYSAESKVPGYTPTIANTAYLEYEFARLGVFRPGGIADPRLYRGDRSATERLTVSRARIEVVPALGQYFVGLGGSRDFAARGNYRVDGDTLVVEVSLDPSEAPVEKTALADLFLRTLLQTVAYAAGSPGNVQNIKELGTIDENLKEYINQGIFDRPILIEPSGK